MNIDEQIKALNDQREQHLKNIVSERKIVNEFALKIRQLERVKREAEKILEGTSKVISKTEREEIKEFKDPAQLDIENAIMEAGVKPEEVHRIMEEHSKLHDQILSGEVTLHKPGTVIDMKVTPGAEPLTVEEMEANIEKLSDHIAESMADKMEEQAKEEPQVLPDIVVPEKKRRAKPKRQAMEHIVSEDGKAIPVNELGNMTGKEVAQELNNAFAKSEAGEPSQISDGAMKTIEDFLKELE